MKIRFICVDKTRSRYLAEGVADYIGRIKRYAEVEQVVLKGAKPKDADADAVRERDAAKMVGALKPGDLYIHLDPDAPQMTSTALAGWLKDRMETGTQSVAVGLPGPQGLGPQAARRADLRLSLSRMTLTHEMTRLVVAEQVYRALRLAAGHPYHK
jgi:23S rRNA (pseudouridine1915-N3)-methyltransferase